MSELWILLGIVGNAYSICMGCSLPRKSN